MIVIGLTGSIAAGKSTVANFIRQFNIPIFDADKCVHKLYEQDEFVCEAIRKLAPLAVQNGKVNRGLLSKLIQDNASLLMQIEKIIHPLVQKERAEFLKDAKADKHEFVLLDVPLLFEIGLDKKVDLKLVIITAEELQNERALLRPAMTLAKLNLIRDRQLSDHEKIARADWIITNSGTMDNLHKQIELFIDFLRAGHKHA